MAPIRSQTKGIRRTAGTEFEIDSAPFTADLTPRKTGRKNEKNRIVTPAAKFPELSELETPSTSTLTRLDAANKSPQEGRTGPRRSLFYGKEERKVVDPNKVQVHDSKAKKKLQFGYPPIETQPNVKEVYTIVRKLTGSIGGNGSSGAIYGELTMGSMQKIVNLMKQYTEFDCNSRFIDVGSGIGKPNLHVSQDPGVAFSFGIEMERSRWMLGMTNLKAVINAARNQMQSDHEISVQMRLGHKCFFSHANIMDARSFDPFTHVYMFSIGFPPALWEKLADIFNNSTSPYLICYHNPKHIIEKYAFDVELLTQAPTSMHGSNEGHTGYLYRRIQAEKMEWMTTACDPLFESPWKIVKGGVGRLEEAVSGLIQEYVTGGRVTRSRGMQHCA